MNYPNHSAMRCLTAAVVIFSHACGTPDETPSQQASDGPSASENIAPPEAHHDSPTTMGSTGATSNQDSTTSELQDNADRLTSTTDIVARASRNVGLLFANSGLYDARAEYVLKRDRLSIFFTTSGFRLAASAGDGASWAMGLQFVGGSAERIEAQGELNTKISSFVGDASTWRAGLSTYRKLIYHNVWPGIDVIYEPLAAGLEYSLIVHPGADVRTARFSYLGVDAVTVSPQGDLLLETPFGAVSETSPIAFQTATHGQTQTHAVDVDFLPTGAGAYEFDVGPYDERQDLVIDPTLLFATFLGGGFGSATAGTHEEAVASAVGATGDVYLTGTADSDFPTTPGAYDEKHSGSSDVFVSRVSADGSSLVWSTFVGGVGPDVPHAMAVNSAGQVIVGGGSLSGGFPTTPGAFDTVGTAYGDGFIFRLSGDGATLQWSTLLGGDSGATVRDIALDSSGDVVMVGSTLDGGFPTTGGAYDTVGSATADGFVSVLAADGASLRWSTLLAGNDWDGITSVALDSAGNVVVAGNTVSADFPTTSGAYSTTMSGAGDLFVSTLSADGSSLLWSTYLGGSGNLERVNSLVVDSAANVTITGRTISADFPTTLGAHDTTFGGDQDAFVTRLSAAGDTLLWSTFLGDTGRDDGMVVTMDGNGDLIVGGTTRSSSFPTTAGAYSRVLAGIGDFFVSKLSAATGAMQWSTLLGGRADDILMGLSLGADANITVVGGTGSSDFPVSAGSIDAIYGLNGDAVVARLSPNGGSLLWATYLGSGHNEQAYDVAVDTAGNPTLVGTTISNRFPTTLGDYDSMVAGQSISFISQYSVTGNSLLWSTYFGGSSDTRAYSVAADALGNITVAGTTGADDFPTTPGAYQTVMGGGTDAFVSRFSSDGTALLWSTFVGGSHFDFGTGIALDASSNVTLGGNTRSTNFPVSPGAYSSSLASTDYDMFIARLASDGASLLWGTYLGGNGAESLHALVVGADDSVTLGGNTRSTDFPTSPGACQDVYGGGITDGAVARLSADGSALLWSTFLGGAGSESIRDLVLDKNDHVITTGNTLSADFPTSSTSYDSTYGGSTDAFATSLEVGGSILWSTYLGGSDVDFVQGVAVDDNGNVMLAGYTKSSDFPTTLNALDRSYGGDYDIFLSQISDQGSVLSWSSFYGGSGADELTSLVRERGDQYYFSAYTTSEDIPVSIGAPQGALGGGTDAFVAVFGSPSSAIQSSRPFDFERIPDGQPTFDLTATTFGPGGLHYEIAWGTNEDFSSAQIRTSGANPGFSDMTVPAATAPYEPGNLVHFQIQNADALVNGQTYWWRARSIDADTGLPGFWLNPRSFTVDESLSKSDWLQTSSEQLAHTTMEFTEVRAATDDVVMSSTLGSLPTTDSSPGSYVPPATTLLSPEGAYQLGGTQAVSPANNTGGTAVYDTFPFNIPANATIDGLELGVNAYKTGARTVTAEIEITSYLMTCQTYTITLGITPSYTVFGGPSDTWNCPWFPNSLTGAGRPTVNVTLTVSGGGAPTLGYIDHIWMRLHHTVPGLRVVTSPAIIFADFPGAVDWQTARWSQGGSTGQLTVEALDVYGVPLGLSAISTAASPLGSLNLASIDPSTHAQIKLRATFDDLSSAISPSLQDWSVTTSSGANTAPLADAGPPFSADEQSTVMLDGSSSSDVNGDVLTYAWTQTGGQTVTLSNTTSPTPTFDAPNLFVDEMLTFSLVVNDGLLDSAASTVDVTILDAINDVPIANAGSAQVVNEGVSVTLDGGGSSDPNGDGITYLWSQLSGPAVGIAGQSVSTPSFSLSTVTAETVMVFGLVVNDGFLDSAIAQVTVTMLNTVNEIPVAVTGGDQSVGEGDAVVLDGSSSHDDNSDPLTYTWIQISGSPVPLAGATTATATFNAPTVYSDTPLTFSLVVNDGTDDSAVTSTTVVITNSVNEPPTANAGVPKSVAEGGSVTLDGIATDLNGDTLTYAWTQTSGIAVSLSDSTLLTPTITGPTVTAASDVTFSLVASDGTADSAASTVTITLLNSINEIPMASAGTAQSATEGDLVTLDATGSSDPNGSALTYLWAQTSGPGVTPSDATSPTPTFTAPAVTGSTSLQFTVTATDDLGGSHTSAPVTITVNDASNAIPDALATATPATTGELTSVTLDGSGSSDADGDTLTYTWAQVGSPAVTLSALDGAAVSFTTPTVNSELTLTFTLVVNDGQISSTATTITVTVQNDINEAPNAHAGADQTVGEQSSVTLNAAGSTDPNSDTLTYLWSQDSGPAVSLDDSTSPTPTFTTPIVTAQTALHFFLVVHDGATPSLVGPDSSVVVTVSNSINEKPVADAGSDQIVGEGSGVSVVLRGAASADPNADPLTYTWSQLSGTVVTLSDVNAASPSFPAPTVVADSVLTFQLVVHDGQIDSLADSVIVTVTNNINEAPVARAGSDQNIAEASFVTLSGDGSSDDNGSALTFSWRQISGPAAILSSNTTSTVTFTAPNVSAAADLVFELMVNDGTDDSAPDLVVITVANTVNLAPVADAGPAQTVDEGAFVWLDGTGSSDDDGDSLIYTWVQTAGDAIILNDPSGSAPSFTAPTVTVAQDVAFELMVSDGQVSSEVSAVVITVVNSINEVPVANPGAAQTVNEEVAVVLDASGSFDANGDALTYQWTQTSGATVTLAQTGASRWTFVSPRVLDDTVVTFELSVSDGDLSSELAAVLVTVLNTINEVPMADAGTGQTVGETTAVFLDATASSDPNGDALTYLWRVHENAKNVGLTIDDLTSPSPHVTFSSVFADALVVFELIASDSGDASIAAFVTIEVLNTINEVPVADAGPNQLVAPGRAVRLDAVASTDANSDALTFAWTQIAGPAVELLNADSVEATFEAPALERGARLEFSLEVTDVHGATHSDSIIVDVAAAIGPPVILSSPRLIAFAGQTYAYDDDALIDAGGTAPLTFELLSAPEGMTLDVSTGALSWTPTAEGAVQVSLAVSNQGGSAEQSFSVEVFGKPQITSVPHLFYLLGASYSYQGTADGGQHSGPSGATAAGSAPMYWTLQQGPAEMLVERETGAMFWQPETVDPVSVVVRVSNAFGYDEQAFQITRQNDGIPTIEATANGVAAFQVPYIYDTDERVSFVNASVQERIVLRVVDAPPGFYVHPLTHAVSWLPASIGTFDVSLGLETPSGVLLSSYDFSVEVRDTGPSAQNAGASGPSVAFGATPQSGQAPLTVVFDASASQGTLGSAFISYRWQFGDDSIPVSSGEPFAAHTYTKAGRYSAVLTAVDALGLRASVDTQIGVSERSNTPPTAAIEADNLQGQDQLTVRFSCLCSDVDGELRSVLWTFGDGESASLKNPSHTYLQPGTYHARVLVRDSAGLTASDSVEVRILAGDRPAPSVQIFATPSEGERPLRVDFSVQASVPGRDPDFIWTLGGGETQTATQFSKTYFDAGYYNVAVEMRSHDAEGNSLRSFDQRTVFVTAQGLLPPRIVSLANASAVVGEPYLYDDDGKPSAQGSRPMVWRLGKQVEGITLNRPEGMEVDLNTGELSWTPDGSQVGMHTVTLLAESTAGSGVQEFTIDVRASTTTAVTPEGCGCRQSSAATGIWLCGLALIFASRGRRRRN